jgi:choline-sulfatase
LVKKTWSWIVAWTAALAVVAGLLGLVADGVRLGLARAPVRFVVAGGASAAALAVLLALAAGPVLAGVVALAERLAKRGIVGKLGAFVPVLAGAAWGAFAITNVRHRQDPGMRQALVAAAAGLIAACVFAARPSAHRLWRLVALAVALGMFLVDALLPRWFYRELHDLLALITVCGFTTVVLPWLRKRSVRGLSRSLAAMVAAACAVIGLVDRAAPGWRSRAHEHGLYGDAFARTARALVDLDRDGFSPVAWGGDCNDFSAARNPLALDGHGKGDLNCNGIDPPLAPTEAQRGLSPASGDANLAPDAVDLVVLVTIDALRADAISPGSMPNLVTAGARGLVFTDTYASSTRTSQSLPLLQQSHRGGQPLGLRLASHGIATTAVVADHDLEGTETIAKTFARLSAPERGRWPAQAATERALRVIDETGTRRHYLWLHFYDAHAPYPEVAAPPVPTPNGLDASFARYATGVAAVDAGFGQLVQGLSQRGRLERAVIIVTGDHGEAFGEHRMLFHAASAYQPLVHVPGLLLAPGLVPRQVRHLVAHADLFPTILGAFALATADDESLGRSWLRLRSAPEAPLHRFVVIRSAQATSGGDVMSPLLAIVDGRYKLIKTIEDGLTELFDVVADPGELVDLWPVHPEIGRSLERQLETYRDVVGYPADEELADLRTFGARLIGAQGEVY